MKRFALLSCAAVIILSAPALAETAAPPVQKSAPPLPFHSVEGIGGAFAVPSAYVVNPSPSGEVFGLPAIGGMHVHVGKGRVLDALTVTETLWGRLELGYGLDHFDSGDLSGDIQAATGMIMSRNSINLHNFNAKFLAIPEGSWDQAWLPALSLGVHYKYNETLNTLNKDLAGTFTAIGIDDNDGWDFTLFASKMITCLPRPIILTAGARSTQAAHIGLLGFTGERKIVPEATLCVLAAPNLAFAFEYRAKPDEYTPIPGLVAGEDDWWTICTGWIVNDRMTLSGGYAHFGDMLNHRANGAWGVALKYEF